MYLFFQGGTELNFGTSKRDLPPRPPPGYEPVTHSSFSPIFTHPGISTANNPAFGPSDIMGQDFATMLGCALQMNAKVPLEATLCASDKMHVQFFSNN